MQRPVCPSGTSQQPHARALRAAPPAAPPAAAPCSCRSGRGARHAPAAPAAANELAALAGSVDPALMQDLLVGGAITAAVGVALYTGLKKDPVPCDLCMGGCGGARVVICAHTARTAVSMTGGRRLVAAYRGCGACFARLVVYGWRRVVSGSAPVPDAARGPAQQLQREPAGGWRLVGSGQWPVLVACCCCGPLVQAARGQRAGGFWPGPVASPQRVARQGPRRAAWSWSIAAAVGRSGMWRRRAARLPQSRAAAHLERPSPAASAAAGTGGIRCFACEGAGTVEKSRDSMDSMDGGSPTPRRRDPVGRSGGNPRACRVCGGTGLVLCSKCRGSGYVN